MATDEEMKVNKSSLVQDLEEVKDESHQERDLTAEPALDVDFGAPWNLTMRKEVDPKKVTCGSGYHKDT